MRTKAFWALMAGAVLLGGLAAPVEASSSQDRAIVRAFEDVLDRQPTESELRRYRDLMYEEHWTERDVREDLQRRSDYGRHSDRRVDDPDRIVRRAYQDILHREPDTEGLRLYRSRMIDQNWTEQDVREALRKSPEYAKGSSESADKIIRRAYQDILGREPDTNGLYSYRSKVLNQGWDEHDVREALRRSPEYRQKSAMTREQAEDVVRRAYQSVLGRDPDAGSRGYVDRVLRDHWTERDVARELRNSDEFRNKQP
jgi:TorA maturation chaperone TorD